MKSFIQSNIYALVTILFIGSYLLLSNLNNHVLWQDEAETACVGRTIVDGSILPLGFDGLNSFSQQKGQEYDQNYVWKLHPWFQFYWIATSFSIFEETTFYARLPFALMGLSTIILSYFLSLLVWEDKKTAWFTVLFFFISVTFLLLSRQARYYSPAMFFSVYASFALFSIYKGNKYSLIHYVIASFLLFHSQYLFAIIFWVVTLIYTFIFQKESWKKIGLTTLILAIPNLLFLNWLLDTPYGEGFTMGIGFSEGLQIYPKFIFNYLLSPLWLAVPIGFYFVSKKTINWKKDEQALVFFLLIVLGNLFALLLLGRLVFVRYLCGIIPFVFLIKGRLSYWLSKIHILVPILAIGIIIMFSDLPKFLKELQTTEFGPVGGIVSFLEMKSQPDDKIGISYGDLPVKFYFPDNRVYGGLADDMPQNLDSLDFIIIRHYVITDRDAEVSSELVSYISSHKELLRFELNVKDLPYECRENPLDHYQNKNVNAPKVVVYTRPEN